MVSDWKTRSSLGIHWPSGRNEFEVESVQAARTEYIWRSMNRAQRRAFEKAAKKGWDVWVANEDVELSEGESKMVWQELKNKTYKVLTLRFVYTDKNGRDLEILASARLVVPGFRDVTACTIRKDAPTCSRTTQHLVLIFTSCNYKKGPYMAGVREIYITNVRTTSPHEPRLPFGDRLCRVRTGVFGLSDAPVVSPFEPSIRDRGWKKSYIDAACCFLWSSDGKTLHGIISSHVDDLLLGGDEVAQKSLANLGSELEFGSSLCGKHISQDKDGVIRIQMQEYHKNLKPAVIPVQRRRDPSSPLSPAETKQLRALLGSMQWLGAQLGLFAISTVYVAVRTPCHWHFRPFDLEGCGLLVVAVNLRAMCSWAMRRRCSFSVLDAVCRSTFAAELYSAEEAFDVGIYCRGALAELQGKPIEGRMIDAWRPFLQQQ